MRTDDLRNISYVLSDLWDFFTSNCDRDDTGLIDEMSDQYFKAVKDVDQEIFKNLVRNKTQKIVRKKKKEVQDD